MSQLIEPGTQNAHDLCVLLVNDAYGELTSVSLNDIEDCTARANLFFIFSTSLPTDELQRIFEGLLRHGRSTLLILQHATHLSLRQIKHGLSVLVQQRLAFWHRDSEDEIVSYEANVSAAYNLLRVGKYVKITENRVGGFASTVVSHLLLLGHTRVGDLMQAYDIGYTKDIPGRRAAELGLPASQMTEKHAGNIQVNGDNSATREKIHETLCDLMQAGLVVPVHESDFRSEQDNRLEAERVVGKLAEYTIKGKSKKEIDASWQLEVRALLYRWKFGSKDERSEIEAFSIGKKRTLEESEEPQSEKRQRLDLGMSKHPISSNGEPPKLMFNNLLKNELVLRVNHYKFTVAMRNDHLAHITNQTIGNMTSRIYEMALRKIEKRLLSCYGGLGEKEGDDDNDEAEEEEDYISNLPSVATNEMAAIIGETSELDDAMGRVDRERADELLDHPKKRRRKSNGIQDEAVIERDASGDEADGSASSDDGSDEVSVTDADMEPDLDEDENVPNGEHVFVPDSHHRAIRQNLLLLAQHPDSYFHHIRSTPTEPERWAVNFRVLRRTAVLKAIFHTIDTRLGTLSTRLARICQEYGRMDDKSLQSKSLLTQKEMRARLLEMQKGGLLDLQEVPRDNSRLASRTTFLYYMDEGKAKARIIDECYKTMTRCLQRLAVEKETVTAVLEKVERSDVKGREEELLGAKEKEALGRWKAQEEMIWGEIGRVDDVVAVLRDF